MKPGPPMKPHSRRPTSTKAYIYPGTHHGFHNDSTPRYDEQAAELAWQRTIAWFQRYLS